jgi:hypothetical protein
MLANARTAAPTHVIKDPETGKRVTSHLDTLYQG